jgi:hypothetical protein
MFKEIHNDRALRYFGALLALAHGVAVLHWWLSQPLADVLAPANWPAVCWPFYPDCAQAHVLSTPQVHGLLALLGVLSLVTAGLFLRARTTLACLSLALLAVLKLGVVALDYRLRLNQHMMTAWLVAAFLLVPNKRRVLTGLLLAIYFWAGVLKLTPEWLDGRALYGRLPLPPALLVPACWYVVVLELALIFGLLSRRAWLFWLTFAQLLLFHAVSVPVVHFFYPLLMLLLLALFPLTRLIPAPQVTLPRWPLFATLGVFSALQFVPLLFPGDALLTGEGRLWALHMFDAPLECQAWLTPHAPDGREGPPVPLRVAMLSNRILCDPLVYASASRGICQRNQGRVGVLDLHLQTRRAGNSEFHAIVDAPDVCAQPLAYSLVRHNAWILGGERMVPVKVGVVEMRGN